MSTVTVRRATQADVDALRPHEPRPELALGQRRLDEMTAGTGLLAVAEVDGTVVGTGYLDYVDEQLQPEVKNLWVLPEHRRHGAGQALWSWLEEQAREAGHQEVFLSVAPDNAGAIGFFLHQGYSPTGDHLVIDNPAEHVVVDKAQESRRYAIYKKSLLAY